jgi:lipoprotein-anchoring transpeptidase ErfK/SrfK
MSAAASAVLAARPVPPPAFPPVLLPSVVSSVRGGSTVLASSPVRVTARNGAVHAVRVSGGELPVSGVVLDGAWQAVTPLSPGVTYRVEVDLLHERGLRTRSFSFATTPSSTRLGIDVTPNQGAVVGVAQSAVLRFNVPVKNKQAVTSALVVSSSPQVEGAWNWVSDSEVRWRPREYWPTGAKVRIEGDLRGIDLGAGVYAAGLIDQSFTVGAKQVVRISSSSKTARVYRDGALVRTYPVSLGKAGFLTRSGTKVILERYRVKRMVSTQTGESYDLQVPYAMRLTWSGEFLHAAPWASSRLGRVHGSHGCTNVSLDAGRWLFTNLQQGDPVVTTGTGRPMEVGNGYGEWNASWDSWSQGTGALSSPLTAPTG